MSSQVTHRHNTGIPDAQGVDCTTTPNEVAWVTVLHSPMLKGLNEVIVALSDYGKFVIGNNGLVDEMHERAKRLGDTYISYASICY